MAASYSVDHGFAEPTGLLVWPCWALHQAISTKKNLTIPETLLTCYCVWLRQAVNGLIPVTQHAGAVAGGQSGSAEADP